MGTASSAKFSLGRPDLVPKKYMMTKVGESSEDPEVYSTDGRTGQSHADPPESLQCFIDNVAIVPHQHVLEGLCKQGQLKGGLILV